MSIENLISQESTVSPDGFVHHYGRRAQLNRVDVPPPKKMIGPFHKFSTNLREGPQIVYIVPDRTPMDDLLELVTKEGIQGVLYQDLSDQSPYAEDLRYPHYQSYGDWFIENFLGDRYKKLRDSFKGETLLIAHRYINVLGVLPFGLTSRLPAEVEAVGAREYLPGSNVPAIPVKMPVECSKNQTLTPRYDVLNDVYNRLIWGEELCDTLRNNLPPDLHANPTENPHHDEFREVLMDAMRGGDVPYTAEGREIVGKYFEHENEHGPHMEYESTFRYSWGRSWTWAMKDAATTAELYSVAIVCPEKKTVGDDVRLFWKNSCEEDVGDIRYYWGKPIFRTAFYIVPYNLTQLVFRKLKLWNARWCMRGLCACYIGHIGYFGKLLTDVDCFALKGAWKVRTNGLRQGDRVPDGIERRPEFTRRRREARRYNYEEADASRAVPSFTA